MNQHEELPFNGFPPQTIIILASRKTYQKLSSNGIDLAELLEPPAARRNQSMLLFGSNPPCSVKPAEA
jgi:hypothetical protein